MVAGVSESSGPRTVDQVLDVEQTTCCVVGGGPAGMMLALLLARRGVPVTLLEAHHDFDRNFRGDTLHPALLEILKPRRGERPGGAGGLPLPGGAASAD